MATTGVRDGVIIFVAQGRELRYSRAALEGSGAVFAPLLLDWEATGQKPIYLRNVLYEAAKASLDICVSHDERGFWELQHRGATLRQLQRRSAPSEGTSVGRRGWRTFMQTLVSLFETCIRFELYFYASICSRTLSRYISVDTTLDVLASAIRYISLLPSSVLEVTGTMTLCRTCMLCIPSTWPDERSAQRWRQLCVQYPEIQLHV